jgi:hypothetical protein
MADGTEPLDPNEIVYRRVIKGSHYKSNRSPPVLSPRAFSPRPKDLDGISFVRQKYVSGPEEAAALGSIDHEYWIIAMRAGDLEREGIVLEPKPTQDCIGHAVAPGINPENAEQPEVLARMLRASSQPFTAHGPYPGKAPPPPT